MLHALRYVKLQNTTFELEIMSIKLVKTPRITRVSVRTLVKTAHRPKLDCTSHVWHYWYCFHSCNRPIYGTLSLKIKGLLGCSPLYNKEPAQRQQIEMNTKNLPRATTLTVDQLWTIFFFERLRINSFYAHTIWSHTLRECFKNIIEHVNSPSTF